MVKRRLLTKKRSSMVFNIFYISKSEIISPLSLAPRPPGVVVVGMKLLLDEGFYGLGLVETNYSF